MDTKIKIAVTGCNKSKLMLNEYFQRNFSNNNSNKKENVEEKFSIILENSIKELENVKKLSYTYEDIGKKERK